jgi:cellulose synthase/poly-beta-1,6-N-acetylglucosamine synthase-like glycosyltransferase
VEHVATEVLLVNDHSTDDSVERVLTIINSSNSSITLLHSELEGKKNALKLGVSRAKYNYIISTDADCSHSKTWLRTMLSHFNSGGINMLCGPVQLTGFGWFSKLQQVESNILVASSASMFKLGLPLNCNGASLLFNKKKFDSLQGHEPTMNYASGDDDLLMHRFYCDDPKQVKFVTDPAALVYTNTESNLWRFMHQRLRWSSKAAAYPFYVQCFGIFVIMFNSLIWICLIIGLAGFKQALFYWLIMIIAKYLAEGFLLWRSRHGFTNYMKQKFIGLMFLPFYQTYGFLLILMMPFTKVRWKDRTI